MNETQTAQPEKTVKFLWAFKPELHRKMKQISEADNRSIAGEVRALITQRHKELFPSDGANLDHAVTYMDGSNPPAKVTYPQLSE